MSNKLSARDMQAMKDMSRKVYDRLAAVVKEENDLWRDCIPDPIKRLSAQHGALNAVADALMKTAQETAELTAIINELHSTVEKEIAWVAAQHGVDVNAVPTEDKTFIQEVDNEPKQN